MNKKLLKKKYRIKLKAEFFLKKHHLQHNLTLIKTANTSILTIQPQAQDLICKFLKFPKPNLEKLQPVSEQAKDFKLE